MGLLLVSMVLADDLYNLTALDNSNNIFEYTLALNTISNNAIGLGFLLIVFAVSFMMNIGNTGNIFAGLNAAGFITALSATILLPLGLITWTYYQVVVVIAAIAVILSYWFGTRGY